MHRFAAAQPDGLGPVTYSPCRPIHYVVRPDNAPPAGAALIEEAFSRAAVATGLHFVADGATTEPVTAQRDPYQPQRYGDRWAPVLVAWATPTEVPHFGVDVVGEAGSQRMGRPNGQQVYVSGQVYLDPSKLQHIIDTAGLVAARAIIEHELGHLVGLAHVDDPTQLMHPRAQAAVSGYQSGDLEGLARLGAGECVRDL
ncbi:MAG: M10 family metallopeptidase domain-containing protein [Actinomycetota bacterium]|nr:M10 family metallopeptidase domain-containing protein [Actinomycetota bacterium]